MQLFRHALEAYCTSATWPATRASCQESVSVYLQTALPSFYAECRKRSLHEQLLWAAAESPGAHPASHPGPPLPADRPLPLAARPPRSAAAAAVAGAAVGSAAARRCCLGLWHAAGSPAAPPLRCPLHLQCPFPAKSTVLAFKQYVL